MSTTDLIPYFNNTCRFKLRSGKEVFGVIWEVVTAEGVRMYFTSLSNAQLVQQAQKDADLAAQIGSPIVIDEIIYAERIAS